MNTRRNFLLQSSMATAALLAAKPFKTFAKISSPVTADLFNKKSLLLLHGNGGSATDISHTIQQCRDRHAQVAYLHTGKHIPENIKADAMLQSGDAAFSPANSYTIFYKGDIKVGVLSACKENKNELSSLAGYLKKEKRCDIVVCLSNLGFRNKSGADDISLAQGSKNIDFILGSKKDNNSLHPYIALNKEQHEVVIAHTANTENALGQIAIAFNDKRQKINIAF